MKSIFFLASLLLVLCTSYAQHCERHGSFHNSSDIETSGDVNIKNNKKGQVVIKLSGNFQTQEGPDLDIYLSKTETVTEAESVRIKPLFIIEGSQRLVSQSPIDLNTYDYVVVHCTKWNHWYGSAKLEDAEGCD